MCKVAARIGSWVVVSFVLGCQGAHSGACVVLGEARRVGEASGSTIVRVEMGDVHPDWYIGQAVSAPGGERFSIARFVGMSSTGDGSGVFEGLEYCEVRKCIVSAAACGLLPADVEETLTIEADPTVCLVGGAWGARGRLSRGARVAKWDGGGALMVARVHAFPRKISVGEVVFLGRRGVLSPKQMELKPNELRGAAIGRVVWDAGRFVVYSCEKPALNRCTVICKDGRLVTGRSTFGFVWLGTGDTHYEVWRCVHGIACMNGFFTESGDATVSIRAPGRDDVDFNFTISGGMMGRSRLTQLVVATMLNKMHGARQIVVTMRGT